MNPSEQPHYLIQINHTGSSQLSQLLRIPPASITVRQAQKLYGREWDKFLSFSIKRNPYSRAAAIYVEYYYANKFRMLEHKISFLTFLNLTLKRKKKPFHDKVHIFRSQWSWLKDFDGDLGVRYLGSFERYDDSVFTFLDFLGRDPSAITLRPYKERGMENWGRYYEGVEGNMAKDLIGDYWKEDFERLDYAR